MAILLSAVMLWNKFIRPPSLRRLMTSVCIVLAIVSCHSLVKANTHAIHNGTWSAIQQGDDSVQLDDPESDSNETEMKKPYFLYSIQDDVTLQAVADKLRFDVNQLLEYNPDLADANSQHTLSPGDTLYVPISFPLHKEAVLLKSDVLPYRFVASYGVPITFSRVADIEMWFLEQLEATGYDILREKANGDINFQGGWVARGTIQLSPGDDTYQTWIHVALVIDEEAFPLHVFPPKVPGENSEVNGK